MERGAVRQVTYRCNKTNWKRTKGEGDGENREGRNFPTRKQRNRSIKWRLGHGMAAERREWTLCRNNLKVPQNGSTASTAVDSATARASEHQANLAPMARMDAHCAEWHLGFTLPAPQSPNFGLPRPKQGTMNVGAITEGHEMTPFGLLNTLLIPFPPPRSPCRDDCIPCSLLLRAQTSPAVSNAP